ncbi:MAG: coproporphyrinogen dehydrogenase HemZ [Lachnospiraceae bacterium]|nr:coproporphyrinogen dehydrogenase HemZ [Lachnospiraceae bacterium]
MKRKDTIEITVNEAGFEYDIHSLVKAFYPAGNVKVSVMPCGPEKEPDLSGADMAFQFTKGAVLLFLKKEESKTASFAAEKSSEDNPFEENYFVEKLSADLSDEPPRPEVKNRIKRLIYEALSRDTGRQLPWGTLTGIRPVKIPMTLLEEGKAEPEIIACMKKNYLISDEKADLALKIARREKALLETLHYENGYSLYIGIPFCPTTCLYCSFTSYPLVSWKKRVGEYLDALEKEIDYAAKSHRGKILDTIYIGGGTPTTLEPFQMQRLLEKIKGSFDLSHLKEFTVEAGRADSITPEKLEVLKRNGVTRISVNPQTMKQETLDLIGRRHTVEQVKEAFAMARSAGFSNINMDIILGLPGENAGDVRHTIEEIRKLNPDSLTVHSLAIKRASKLSQWIAENGISALNNTEETMEITAKGAAGMGMEPYYLYRQKNMSGNFENVGYAREGKFGIYNILIMEEKQNIVALGAGSISKRLFPGGRIERCENVKEVAQYIERIDEMIERKRKLLED